MLQRRLGSVHDMVESGIIHVDIRHPTSDIRHPTSDIRHPLLPLLTITVFLSAALMFTLQPLVARLLLPVMGGSPAVWNTCMVFFQAVLLAGYAYAHAIGGMNRGGKGGKGGTARLGAAVHLAVLVVGMAALPVALPRWAMNPPTAGGQAWWALLVLAAVAGLPMFAVSATAPLAQRLLAASRHPAREKPYFLYAASNAGSLLALLSYPVLIEPGIGLRLQGQVWMAAYGVFVAMAIGCVVLAMRVGFGPPDSAARAPTKPQRAAEARIEAPGAPAAGGAAWRERAWWLALSAVPSSLLLGVTNYLSTDVAAIPLLWVVPLAVYLGTFIIAFSERARAGVGPQVTTLMLPAMALSIALTLNLGYTLGVMIAQQLLLLLVAALACHVELARRAPAPARLTEFYLFVAAGGVLGGAFNSLLAPVVFDSVLEYPVAIVAACGVAMLAASRVSIAGWWRQSAAGLLIGGAAAGAVVVLRVWIDSTWEVDERLLRVLAFGPAIACAVLFCRARPLWFAGVLCGLLAVAWNQPRRGDEGGGPVLLAERTFFGVHRVNASPSGMFHTLTHGTTVHGLQFRTEELRTVPTMYYHPTGPIGHVFRALESNPACPGPRRVAVVGLGSGALAAYARPGSPIESMDFYEIDAAVVRIARDSRLFTYLSDVAEARRAAQQPLSLRAIVGDGRLELVRAVDRAYDLIVLDAFSSDAIPVHLLTLEALGVYLSRLAPGGIIAVHISNRHIDLVPVLQAIGKAATPPMVAWFANDPTPTGALRKEGKAGSQWAVLARDEADLRMLHDTPGMFWGVPDRPLGARAWTDDWSDVVGQLRVFK